MVQQTYCRYVNSRLTCDESEREVEVVKLGDEGREREPCRRHQPAQHHAEPRPKPCHDPTKQDTCRNQSDNYFKDWQKNMYLH